MNETLAYRHLGTILRHPDQAMLAVQTVGERYWLDPWPNAECRTIAKAILAYVRRGESPGLNYLLDEFEEDPPICELLRDLPRHAEAENFVYQQATRLKAEALLAGARQVVTLSGHQFQDDAANPIELSSKLIVALSEYASSGTIEVSTATMTESLINQYDAIASGSRPDGLKLFHPILDGLLGGGIPYGKMVVLGARPSHGKTSLLCNWIDFAIRSNHPTVFFSFDDDHELAQSRMACIHAGISFRHAWGGRLRPDTAARYKQALHWIARAPITFVSHRGLSPLQCRAKLHAYLSTIYPGQKPLVCLDFLQKQAMAIEDSARMDTRNRVSLASAQWKDTIEELGVPGIVLAQLNREGRGEPHLEHLKESGSIEEDAYAVILLWRPGRDDPEKPANKVYAFLRKNKGGPTGTALYNFSGWNFRYLPWNPDDIELNADQMANEEHRLINSQTTNPEEDI